MFFPRKYPKDFFYQITTSGIYFLFYTINKLFF